MDLNQKDLFLIQASTLDWTLFLSDNKLNNNSSHTYLNYQQSHDIHRLTYPPCQPEQLISRISIKIHIKEAVAFDSVVQGFVAKKANDS